MPKFKKLTLFNFPLYIKYGQGRDKKVKFVKVDPYKHNQLYKLILGDLETITKDYEVGLAKKYAVPFDFWHQITLEVKAPNITFLKLYVAPHVPVFELQLQPSPKAVKHQP